MRKNLHHKIMLSILAGSLALGFVYAPPAFAEDVLIADTSYTAPDGTPGTYDLDAEGTTPGTNYNNTSITLPTGPIDKFTVQAGSGGYTDISHGSTVTGGNGGSISLSAIGNAINKGVSITAGNGGYIYAPYGSNGNLTGGNGGNVTLTFTNVVSDSISLISGTNSVLSGTGYNCTPGNGGSVNFTAESIKASSSNSQLSIRFNKNYGDITFDVGTLNIADNTVKITAAGNSNILTAAGKTNHINNLILTGNGNIDTTNASGIKIGQLTIDGGEINDTNWAGFHERAYGNDIFNIKNGGVTFNINNSLNLKHGLTGKGGLTKTGNGTLELAKGTPGINFDYEGITTITQGTIDASVTTSTLSKSAGLTLYGGATFVANNSQDWNEKQFVVYDNGSDNSATYQGNLTATNSNLYFIASGDNTNPLLKVINNGTDNNGNVNIGGSKYNLGLTGDKILDIGSKLTLIEADGTINADNLEPGSGIKVGSTIKQDITTNVEVSVDDSGSTEKLIATVNGALATDEASAINTGMLGGLAFNLQGADLIAREGMEAAVRSAQLDNNHAVFAALTRSSLDYGTIDVDGTNMLAGLAWRSTTGAGSMTYGVFAEHGDGSYDTYANINGTSLHGEGDTDYTGGGILARMDFNGSENGHGYLEASGRVGNADTDYTNSGLRDAYGRAASYSTDGTYYGAHIGAGYVQKLDEKSSIDWYGKLLWARLEGGSADLSTGEHLTFDDADSLRLRIGGRWNYAASDFVSYYAGLGYEYEFDGEASGFTNGLALGDEDLTGGSGVAELGISFKPSKNSPFSLELNLSGFTGEREGFRGGVEAVYTF